MTTASEITGVISFVREEVYARRGKDSADTITLTPLWANNYTLHTYNKRFGDSLVKVARIKTIHSYDTTNYRISLFTHVYLEK